MAKKRAAKQRMPGVAGGGPKNGQAAPEPRKAKPRLQILSDASFEAIFLSERGICIDQNLTAEKLFGYTLQEAVGRHGSEWIIPQDRERVKTMMLLDYTAPYYVTALRKDGTTFACEIQARTMDMGGRSIRVTALRDITARTKSDDEIKENEEKLRQIMENISDVVWLISFDQSRMLYVSPSYERVWGRSCQSLYDNPRGYMQTIHPRDKLAVITRFRQYGLTGRFDHTFRIVRPNGGVRWIHARMFPIRDERGEVVRHAGISTDITEEKLAEETLHKAESELVQANALLAVRANQLRALAGELTMAEQRERKRVSKVLHDGLQQNLASARLQLAGIMEQQNAALLVPELNEIDQVIAESIAMSRSLIADLSPPVLHDRGLGAGLEWLARRMQDKHGLSVELCIENNIELAEDIKHLVFESVRELLFNIVKHAGADHAQVRMQHSQEAGMRITIRDEGVGFDPERLKSAGDVGCGFGLFSISERIGLLGGTFEIDSAPGKGSRFVLTVPARHRVTTAPGANHFASMVDPQKVEPVLDSQAKFVRVLVVDDHALFRDGITRLVNKEPDISVVGQAANGREAIELARQLNPDVILMDINMPQISGVEATRTIHRELPHIRIIGLSMHDDHEVSRVMFEAGAFGYKNKGCAAAELIAAIRDGVQAGENLLSIDLKQT